MRSRGDRQNILLPEKRQKETAKRVDKELLHVRGPGEQVGSRAACRVPKQKDGMTVWEYLGVGSKVF